jgi:drug/metabolite transporter (DMT)-like permease
LSGWQIACYRSAIAGLLLAAAFPRCAWPKSWKEPLVGLAYAGTMLLFVHANKLTLAADVIFLQSTAPVYVSLLAPWLLHERVRPRDLVLLALIIAGAAMCLLGGRPASATAPQPFLGDMLGLASGATWALTLTGLRYLAKPGTAKTSEGRNPAVTAALWGNIAACLACAPLAIPQGGPGPRDLIALLYLGVFQIGLAYICLTWAMKATPALQAALLLQLEPTLNPLWAWLVHGEAPGGLALAGGGLILASALAATLLGERPSPVRGSGAGPTPSAGAAGPGPATRAR